MTAPADDTFAVLARLTDVLPRWSYEGTTGAERIITRVAARYGATAEVTLLADAAVLTVGEHTVARSAEPGVPPPHQVSALKKLLAGIDRGELSAAEALRRWDGAGLGLAVGLLVIARDGRPRLTLVAPFIASAAAMLELADVRVTSGAVRLIYGLAVPLMLGFGAPVATLLVGVPQSALFDVDVPGNLGLIAVAGGWVLFAAGVMFTFSMAPADFPWALGMVLGTAAVAALGSAAFGDAVGTLAGAVAMTIAALLLGRGAHRPPPYVLYLGAFSVLTPGSHGLRGIESWIGGHPVQGVAGIADMLGMLTAIGIGMLLGAALVRRPLSAET